MKRKLLGESQSRKSGRSTSKKRKRVSYNDSESEEDDFRMTDGDDNQVVEDTGPRIDKVLDWRIYYEKGEDGKVKEGEDGVEEWLIKWVGQSYLHIEVRQFCNP
tara:strand:+ start:1251 stop:1562 length:312 start_codon:yes stop_codon:yes gene_type:complete